MGDLKDAFLAELTQVEEVLLRDRRGAGAADRRRGDRIVFTFAPQHRTLRVQFDQTRAALEALATQLAGRKMAVVALEGAGCQPRHDRLTRQSRQLPSDAPDRQATLRQQALADSGCRRCWTCLRRRSKMWKR